MTNIPCILLRSHNFLRQRPRSIMRRSSFIKGISAFERRQNGMCFVDNIGISLSPVNYVIYADSGISMLPENAIFYPNYVDNCPGLVVESVGISKQTKEVTPISKT